MSGSKKFTSMCETQQEKILIKDSVSKNFVQSVEMQFSQSGSSPVFEKWIFVLRKPIKVITLTSNCFPAHFCYSYEKYFSLPSLPYFADIIFIFSVLFYPSTFHSTSSFDFRFLNFLLASEINISGFFIGEFCKNWYFYEKYLIFTCPDQSQSKLGHQLSHFCFK